MRYPLPYAFARDHGLLLEDDGQQLTLWLSPESQRQALSGSVSSMKRCRISSDRTNSPTQTPIRCQIRDHVTGSKSIRRSCRPWLSSVFMPTQFTS